jgi:phosphopantothenoylcysteine decarboxylase/phosphopantothenate--cysteine ligase
MPAKSNDLTGYEVIVAVCGGIAAYKTCAIVSALVQRGAGVTVAMTESATQFVGPVTFQALSARRVLTSLWSPDAFFDPQHIRLTENADGFLIAPATANIIGKIAAGIADDLISTLVISARPPVLLAPAMNDRMWENPIVQSNVQKLRELGYVFVGPAEGWMACRTVGMGRTAEPAEIVQALVARLKSAPPKGRVPRDV